MSHTPERRSSIRKVPSQTPSDTRPRVTPDDTRPRRDPFPLVIGGLAGALTIAILVLVVLLLSLTARPGASTAPSSVGSATSGTPATTLGNNSAEQGPGTAVPEEGKDHVDEGTPITYKSYPPSSGTHYVSTVEYGFWEREKPEGALVHNLEHGAVVLYYKPGLPPQIIQSLRDTFVSIPPAKYGKAKLIITPYSKLQSPLVLAAWG